MGEFGVKGEKHDRNITVFMLNVFIIYGVYIPIICYYLYRFYRLKSVPWIQNRYPILTIWSAISIIGVLFFGTHCGFLYINGLNHFYLLIILFFIFLSGSLFAHSILVRIWLLYYKTRLNKAILNNQWQSIINPNKNIQENACPENNPNAFYLQNRKTYGNYCYMMQKFKKGILFDIIFVIAMFGVIIILKNCNVSHDIITGTFTTFIGVMYFILFIFPLIFIIYIYRIIPDFYDSLGLREELLFTARMYFISIPAMLLLLTALAIDQMVTDHDREGEESGLPLFYIAIVWQINAVVMFLVALKMIKLYPDRLRKMYGGNTKRSSSSNVNSTSPTVTVSVTPITTMNTESSNIGFVQLPETGKKLKKLKIKDILQHKECFEVFIEHLAHEYCMEGLLSIIEITQYRDYMLLCEPLLKQQYNNPANHKAALSDSITSSNSLTPSSAMVSSPSSSTITTIPSMTSTGSETNSLYNDGITKYYDLPNDIVKSDIVYPGFYKALTIKAKCIKKDTIQDYIKENMINDKEERKKRYKEMAFEIFDKYIRTGSEYEINVSYTVRMKYMSLMGSNDIWMNGMKDFDESELFRLFEDCYDEMLRLMSQSFTRFKRTDKFDKVREVLR